MVLDHCSIGWACDETVDMSESIQDVTIQWSVLNEMDYGCTTPDGYGRDQTIFSWGTSARLSLHHTLAVHAQDLIEYASPDIDLRNNVVYNYVEHGIEWFPDDAQSDFPFPHNMNVVGNYFKRGANSATAGPIEISASFYYHVADNYFWRSAGNETAVQNQITSSSSWLSLAADFSGTPPVTTHPAAEAYTKVLDSSGAWPRDSLDKRNIRETRTATGSTGLKSTPLSAGLTAGTAPADADADGLPDCWETNNGLNPADSGDANDPVGDGYTWIEKYCHFRAEVVLGRIAADQFCGAPAAVEHGLVSAGIPRLAIAGNPFHGSSVITVNTPGQRTAELQIISLAGKLVRSWILGNGGHTVIWNGTDHQGRPAAAGMYLARLTARGRVLGQVKMIKMQ
jgi:hypothetical protein